MAIELSAFTRPAARSAVRRSAFITQIFRPGRIPFKIAFWLPVGQQPSSTLPGHILPREYEYLSGGNSRQKPEFNIAGVRFVQRDSWMSRLYPYWAGSGTQAIATGHPRGPTWIVSAFFDIRGFDRDCLPKLYLRRKSVN